MAALARFTPETGRSIADALRKLRIRIATELGRPVVKNVVALGAVQAATEIFPEETLLTAIRQALKSKCAMIPLNEEAFARGSQAVRNHES